jgi:hypothetical protein
MPITAMEDTMVVEAMMVEEDMMVEEALAVGTLVAETWVVEDSEFSGMERNGFASLMCAGKVA